MIADLKLEAAQKTATEVAAATTNSTFQAEAIQMDIFLLEETVKNGVKLVARSPVLRAH